MLVTPKLDCHHVNKKEKLVDIKCLKEINCNYNNS